MNALRRLLDGLPLWLISALCLTIGLAPFTPEPHILEKLSMLVAGDLVRAIDILDLLMHGAPFLLLAFKLAILRL